MSRWFGALDTRIVRTTTRKVPWTPDEDTKLKDALKPSICHRLADRDNISFLASKFLPRIAFDIQATRLYCILDCKRRFGLPHSMDSCVQQVITMSEDWSAAMSGDW
jgi:hypothetical protein